MHEALLWESEGDRVRCGLCPHRCAIADGRSGICGVRANESGTLMAMTYAQVSSVAADPIEKKPVFHYRPGTAALSLGSVGCSMKCLHCQNWHISQVTPDEQDLTRLPAEDVPLLARRHGCDGVAFTYNEPVIWAEYVVDAAQAAHRAGLYTVMVTNGYITPEGLDLLGEHIDVWRVDVKGIDDDAYRRLCKVPAVGPVLEMAARAQERWGMHVEVVTNVVPGYNDSEESLRGIARWIVEALGVDTPWHVTRFHPYLELAHLSPTPLGTLREARDIGTEEGLSFVYLGNVSLPGGEDTVCPTCGRVAIRRIAFDILGMDEDDGSCVGCGRDLHVALEERTR